MVTKFFQLEKNPFRPGMALDPPYQSRSGRNGRSGKSGREKSGQLKAIASQTSGHTLGTPL